MNGSTKGRGGAVALCGWLIAGVYGLHAVLTVVMPRTEKTGPLREALRSWHYLLGLVLFALLAWRVLLWWRDRRAVQPAAAGELWPRQLALTTYLVLLAMPVLGITQAWTEGLSVRLGPLPALPALLGENHAGWMFSGYFHSALGFAVTLLHLVTVLSAAGLLLLRGRGLLAAFPPGFGVQAWLGTVVTVYAFSTFQGPEPGVPAVLIVVLLTALVWGAGRGLARRRTRPPEPRPAGAGTRAVVVAASLLPVVLAAWLPFRMFGVKPWPMGEVIEAAEGVTSHPAPVTTVAVGPETEFERQVREDTYKWCRFCHTVEAGGRHLAGPNLYAIFGQQAGTVPNFHYTPAMAQAGRDGLVWTDETLDRFLAGPSDFIPGTNMVISIGPIRDSAERRAIINILKREAMPPAAIDAGEREAQPAVRADDAG